MNETFTFFAGAALGALSSWLITHRYYLKASASQSAELGRLAEELKSRNTLHEFERLLGSSVWSKQYIDHSEVWVCESDNTFQVAKGERTRDFTERWTSVYPDRNTSAYPVYLKIGGVVVKELTFIAMDGGRIFVPMTELRPISDDAVEYFWNVNSLEVRVCRVIGNYYIYKDLEGVAKRSKVAIVE